MNELETSVVNESSVFEPLKFYSTYMFILFKQSSWLKFHKFCLKSRKFVISDLRLLIINPSVSLIEFFSR